MVVETLSAVAVDDALGSPSPAALARLEGEVAIGTLLRRLPGLRLTTESLEYQPTLGLRALSALPLAFDRGEAA